MQMKLLRGENIRNTLFDIQLAYYMLDSSGDTIVSASEIRGFMQYQMGKVASTLTLKRSMCGSWW